MAPVLGAKQNRVKEAHVRLFHEDVTTLKKIADARGTKWQLELRLLVRRALQGEQRDVVVIKDQL